MTQDKPLTLPPSQQDSSNAWFPGLRLRQPCECGWNTVSSPLPCSPSPSSPHYHMHKDECREKSTRWMDVKPSFFLPTSLMPRVTVKPDYPEPVVVGLHPRQVIHVTSPSHRAAPATPQGGNQVCLGSRLHHGPEALAPFQLVSVF